MSNVLRPLAISAAAFSLALAGGCGPTPAAAKPAPEMATTSPEAVVRSVLANFEYETDLIAARNRDAAKTAVQDSRRLFAEAELQAAARKAIGDNPAYETIFGSDAVIGFRNNWAAMIAYDRPHLDVPSMTRVAELDGGKRVTIRVPARTVGHSAVLFDCFQTAADRWAVSMIQFQPTSAGEPSTAVRTPGSLPVPVSASQPAANAASAPAASNPTTKP